MRQRWTAFSQGFDTAKCGQTEKLSLSDVLKNVCDVDDLKPAADYKMETLFPR